MAVLVTLQGPEAGRQFALTTPTSVLGRQLDCAVCLSAKAVSRQHAQIVQRDGAFYIEDLGSSNGTYVNGMRVNANELVPLSEKDTIQIGPYVMTLRSNGQEVPTDEHIVIREEISAMGLDQSVYTIAPAQKLQVVLDISQGLAHTLDLHELLNKLLDQLMRLFVHADRVLVLLCEDDELSVRGQRWRQKEYATLAPYSRTVVKRALAEGVGLLSEDVESDRRFVGSATLTNLNLHSLMCVPLICQDGRRLGVVQVDRFRPAYQFRMEDLQLLTMICQQVAIALDNAALHAELLREERLRQELALAREIQQGFLPTTFGKFAREGFQVFACVHPAREVSGDLYDYSRLPDGRLAFFVGDVSGKGMPAALFMVAVRTLCRHLAGEGNSPATTLYRLNKAIAEDNPSGMFVTLAHGIYDPSTGEVVLASGGHHLPLVRRANGQVEELAHRAGRLLGYAGMELHLTDIPFALDVGDTLVLYTDGITEARVPATKEMFGLERLKELVGKFDCSLSLPQCADLAKYTIHEFTGVKELQDDVTMFLLRRCGEDCSDTSMDNE